MGLTIQYSINSTARSPKQGRELVEKMRQLALDLPFEEVGDVVELDNPDYETCEESHRWLAIQSQEHIRYPWKPNTSTSVTPTKLFAVSLWPGEGCEEMNIGLCSYPREVRIDHRTIKTQLPGFRWSSFCKTQYASNPECGGVPNFLRCHISSITLLERIAELPRVSVEIDDEGKYGPSHYSDDYRKARAAGREPTYVWHTGKYNVKALVEEIGEWNQMVAALGGALKDTLASTGMSVLESPITSFPDFEQLEFRGSRNEKLVPFLLAMKQLSKQWYQMRSIAKG